MSPPLKIVFFGSSDFSVPPLEFCLKSRHEVTAVVTTPDRPKGRGLAVLPNPVESVSQRAGILTLAPSTLKDPSIEKRVADLNPDLFVVASYGKMIPASWLRIPQKMPLNLHPSLLPKYRGAAPIPWQILEGEKETGATVLEVTPKLDSGDLFHQIRIPLDPRETSESLSRRLAHLCGEALGKTIEKIEKGKVVRIPQNEAESSYARKLVKEDGRLQLTEPALLLERKVRAFLPWPGAFIPYRTDWLRVVSAECDSASSQEAEPGTLLEIHPSGSIRVQFGKGSLKLFNVQLPGRKMISATEFAHGQRLKPGFRFGSSPS